MNNNSKGDKMILDVELTAKPITDGEFWILTDGKNKVGNVSANIEGYGVNLAGQSFQFSTTDEIIKNTKIKFVTPEVSNITLEVPYPEFPCPNKTFNSVFDVARGLHVFTKTEKSKCFHAAGYCVVEQNNTTEVIFCPKYIFIQRYPYSGPYKTKIEAQSQINI